VSPDFSLQDDSAKAKLFCCVIPGPDPEEKGAPGQEFQHPAHLL
jgi:hypothetical protein